MQRRNLELKNNIVFLSVIFLLISIFVINNFYSTNKARKNSRDHYQEINSKLAKQLISEKAIITIKALKFRNFKLLENISHPILGIRFSPYPYILSSDKVIFGKEMQDYYQAHQKYDWGHNRQMKSIKLTFKNYYNQYIYNQDFANYDEITFNSKLSNPTKMIDNTRKFYPSSIIVELKINGIFQENHGKDWTILRLVFNKFKNDWYLVAVINLRGII